MTPQEIFTTAYLGVMTQGRASLNHAGTCKYRGQNGAKCALGFLIDDATASVWDDPGANITKIHLLGLTPEWMRPHIELLGAIQACHDDAIFGRYDSFSQNFHDRMAVVASNFNLNLEIPK